MREIHFIAGLPRSGKTLFAALLRQNPAFRAGITSPAFAILSAVERASSRSNELAIYLTDEQKLALRRGVFTAMYPEDAVVFDTNRLWPSKMDLLAAMFPKAKVICFVRNVAWVMDSLERLYRSAPLELSGIYGWKSGTTAATRVAKLAASDGMVGWALDSMREAYYGQHRNRLFIAPYDELAKMPHLVLNAVYDFIGEPRFSHDIHNVEFCSDPYDYAIGAPGLHRVRREVKFIPRQTILPPQLFARYNNDEFWSSRLTPVREEKRGAAHG